MIYVMGMGGEILRGSVLKHEKPIRFEKRRTVLEHQVGQTVYLGQGIRRIGEDKVVGLGCFGKELKHIGPQERDLRLGSQGVQEFVDE